MNTQSETPVLIAGQVSVSHFEKLLKFGTDIRSEKTINALREHLVNGTQKTESCRMHEAQPPHFSCSLKTLQVAARKSLELFSEAFYVNHQSGQKGSQGQVAVDLA